MENSIEAQYDNVTENITSNTDKNSAKTKKQIHANPVR